VVMSEMTRNVLQERDSHYDRKHRVIFWNYLL
jgi:hypothetical protein